MTDAEFLDAIKALRERQERLFAEVAPKQARYEQLRKEMSALIGEPDVKRWEEGRPGRPLSGGAPNWLVPARCNMREEIFQLVSQYVGDACSEWLLLKEPT